MKMLNVEKLVDELSNIQRDMVMNGDPSFTVLENAVIGKALDLVIEAIEAATGEIKIGQDGEK